jgi:nitrite reductase/ring-hydroxylating ferredoxin subunit
MGEAMRRFWIPALSSFQLPEPDCPPVKVEIMGEKLVAFRNTEGTVGILAEKCCHRGASLALGRVEDCGIRCIFHGWKFAPDGTVMETPNVSNPAFRQRFTATAYPVREAGGFIWTYIGPKEFEPPFPHWGFFDVPESYRTTQTMIVPGNYVGYVEALLDSAHLTLLHRDAFGRDIDTPFAMNMSNAAKGQDPVIEVEDTTFGFHYAAIRDMPGDGGAKPHARITSFISPFYCALANGDLIGLIVPMNDTRTLHHFVWWSKDRELAKEPHRQNLLTYVGLTDEMMHSYGIHPASWHQLDPPRRENNFRQDREAMRNGAYSGLPIFFPEDVAVLASTDDIRDRSDERLAPGDAPIARLYQTLLSLADAVERGERPSALDVDPGTVVGTHGFVPDNGTWRELVPQHEPAKPRIAQNVRLSA